jgi:L-ascorbate metabolism protein UlaG (beta-lactamase superfamily)
LSINRAEFIASLVALPFVGFENPSGFVSNPELETLPIDGWKGTPLDKNGRFVNLEFPFEPEFSKLLKWRFSSNEFAEIKKKDRWRPGIASRFDFNSDSKNRIIWLGHASFLVFLNGKKLLIDPVFSDLPMVNRYVASPFKTSDFTQLDAILISHDHRDHCDESTIRALAVSNPQTPIVCGLKLTSVVKPWLQQNPTIEMGWFQCLPFDGITISFIPTRHWARRGLTDTNQTLWGAFMFEGDGKTVYFGSDTGFGNHFKQTAALFPNIDVAMLGIGAYEPRWFMEAAHMAPEHAWTGFKHLGAKKMIPMHFGVFDLSDEPPSQPLDILQKTAGETDQLHISDIGEALLI